MSDSMSKIAHISRLITYLYAVFIIYTLSLRHLPNNPQQVIDFGFFMLLNFGTQWGTYRLLHICPEGWQEKFLLVCQLGLLGWSLYAFRFAHIEGLPYQKEMFFDLPLQQYGVLFALMLFFLLVNSVNR